MNIIVICSDTFRHDHLGFIKRQQVFTPNLDQLARESACFSDFLVGSFPTLVHRIEVFSGRHTFPLMDWGPQPFHFPVLAEVFKHHGFQTALIADNPHLMNESFGFDRGFDSVQDIPGQAHDQFQPSSAPMAPLPCPVEKLEPSASRLSRYRRNAHWYQQQGTSTTECVFRKAMQWLEEPREKFFLWMDAFDPHEPWDAPKNFLKQYPWDETGDEVIWPHSGKADRYSAADLANIRSLYKAEVSQTDHWVGELMSFLRKRSLLEDTIVIFCSDHGYYFGEHGLLGKPLRQKIGKPIPIYEELGHLPFLLRHPSGISAGKSIPGLCQPIDLVATLLDLAQIPKVPWFQGESLVQRLKGEQGGRQFVISGCHPRQGKVSCLTVWTDDWCFVYSPTAGLENSELYERATDPTQLNNVIAGNRAIAAQHFKLLCDWLKELGVPPARQRQLLHAVPFGRWNHFKHWLWMLRNRWHYFRHYRNYARAESKA
jgi:arylsulfatase A-like enzyme